MIAAMKTQVIVSSRLALGLLALSGVGAFFAAPGCSSDPTVLGSGGGSSSSSSASSTSGVGGSAQDAGPNPLSDACGSLCTYLDSINCTAWPNCSTECLNGFNASNCPGEVKALIECWVANQATFTCSMTQLIPPSACQDLETKFNECLAGSGSTGSGVEVLCPGQTKNGTDTTCAAKTECSDGKTVFKSTCALTAGGMDWTCSCYSGDTLLGTCSDTMDICDNHAGCCVPFFFLSQQ